MEVVTHTASQPEITPLPDFRPAAKNCARADERKISYAHIVLDDSAGIDDAMGANHRTTINNSTGRYHCTIIDLGRGRKLRACMNHRGPTSYSRGIMSHQLAPERQGVDLPNPEDEPATPDIGKSVLVAVELP